MREGFTTDRKQDALAAENIPAESDTPAQALAWLQRGHALERLRTPEGLAEAARSHEAGLRVLEKANSAASDVSTMRLRALLWMNRGNALLALGSPEAAREALHSYDETLRLAADSTEKNSMELHAMLGAAWLNRGAAARLACGAEAAGREEALCEENALRELGQAAALGSTAARLNLAGVWLNRATRLEKTGDADAALAAWREAAASAQDLARENSVALESCLRARHALCVALAARVKNGGAPTPAGLAEARAGIFAGLADFAAWQGRAESSRETAARLFELGAWCFRVLEPGRLVEFLAAYADPADVRRGEVALRAIAMARQEIARAGFDELLGDKGAELRRRWRELREIEERLLAPKQARVPAVKGF